MSVADILRQKGREVLTISAERALLDVVDVLADKSVGALVVVDAPGAMVGIISERDVVRAIARGGSNALDSRVADHMTWDVVTATMDESIVDLLAKMTAGRFRHVPILEAGRLAGLVSSGDAVKHRLDRLETEQTAFRDYIATA